MNNLNQPISGIQTHVAACRLICGMSIFAFVAFLAVDPFIFDGPLLPFWICRAVIVVVAAIILSLTWTAFGKKSISILSMAIAAWTGIGIVLLTELAGGASSFYWAMVMLTYFTCALVLPLTTRQALISFGSVAVFYFGWLVSNDATGSNEDWAASNAGIWLSLIVSVLAVKFLCKVRRQRVEQHQELVTLNKKLVAEIAERKIAEEAFLRSQKLDAVGRLAAGLTHEINNVLMVITGTAECIQINPDNATYNAQKIVESSQRGGRLTSGLLQFARQATRENMPFDLREVVGQVHEIVQRSHRGRIDVEYAEELTPCWVVGDAQLISQALLNLALNGIDAMEGAGKMFLGIRLCDQAVEVEVRDSGCGMEADVLNRVFEPFFTTKPPGSGTGLGLSMAYGTLQEHGGVLRIESKPGSGTRAIMSLPVSEQPQSEHEEMAIDTTTGLVAASAILVDDDAWVRSTMRANLENLGIKVIETAGGVEAVEKFSSTSSPVDLVVIDMAMPEMDGHETFLKIRNTDPDQPILIYSGFAKNHNVSEMLESGRCRFLRKPFRNRELHNAISQIVPTVNS